MSRRVPAIFDPLDSCSPLSIPSTKTALLLLDYHNFTTAFMGDAAPSIMATTRCLQQWAVENEITVFHCLVETKTGLSPKSFVKAAGRWIGMMEKLKKVPTLQDEHLSLAFINQDGETEQNDYREPGLVSALKSPALELKLKEKGIKSLILGGISTSGCLLSTCRAATDDGYIVTVVEDTCFDPTPGLHDMLMEHVISSTAHVAKLGELKDVWKER